MEKEAREYWQNIVSWTLGVLAATAPKQLTLCRVDLTGEALDTEGVRKARALKIEYLKKMTVYSKVPMDEARSGGRQVLGARWAGVRKANGAHRSRLVAKLIKTCNAPELFVATRHSIRLNVSCAGRSVSLPAPLCFV